MLEIFDGDGSDPATATAGSFAGGLGCDANGDAAIDAGDLSCTVLLIFNGPGACGGATESASQATGGAATLAVADRQPLAAGATVALPVTLQSGGHLLRAAVFAVNFDPARLTLDATDGNRDGISDGVQLMLGAGQVGSAVYQAEEGRVEITIFGTALESAPLTDGTLATLLLTAHSDGNGEQPLTLTDGSLGDAAGQSVPVSVQNGSLLITPGPLEHHLYLPLVNR